MTIYTRAFCLARSMHGLPRGAVGLAKFGIGQPSASSDPSHVLHHFCRESAGMRWCNGMALLTLFRVTMGSMKFLFVPALSHGWGPAAMTPRQFDTFLKRLMQLGAGKELSFVRGFASSC